ncbi:MAG: pyridoxal-dependent decarboxylase [Planctomycetota bacterium]
MSKAASNGETRTLQRPTDAEYIAILGRLRKAFPSPILDREHDARLESLIRQSLQKADKLKLSRPLLGTSSQSDDCRRLKHRLCEQPQNAEDVTEQLAEYLQGMMILGHPQTQVNVGPSPTIPSIVGGLLPTIYNANLVSDEASGRVSRAETEAIAITADLLGYPPGVADGVFTFGGTGTLLYAAKVGLEKACPGTRRTGHRHPAVILCSHQAHHSSMNVASWLGLGEDHVVHVATGVDNSLRLDDFEFQLRRVLADGNRVACIIATVGTTDAFGLDDLQGMRRIRDALAAEFQLSYRPHLHADAVIGWAWRVFCRYDFMENELGFCPRTLRALEKTHDRLQALPLADSIGVDYHKTGFAPYISSAVVFQDKKDLRLIAREADFTPYLFSSGDYHPGTFTLETSRSGAGPMSALANLRLFGTKGLQSLLGHLVSMADYFRSQLEAHAVAAVLNDRNGGPVTLFRVYPAGVDMRAMLAAERTDRAYQDRVRAHNDLNRRVFEMIQKEAHRGEGALLSMTECCHETDHGEPIVALKSYLLSPFCEPEHCDGVLHSIDRARRSLE